MFKKMIQKIYKAFLIGLVAIRYFFMSIFNDDTSSSESTKNRPFRKNKVKNIDNNIDLIYIEVKKIEKDIVKIENNLSMDKKEKKSEIIKLNDRLDILDAKRKNIVPKNNIMRATNEETIKTINKNKKELKEYAYLNKIDIKPKKSKNKKKSDIKEISVEDVVNLSENNNIEKEIYSLYVVIANTTLKEAKHILKEIEEDTKKKRKLDTNIYKILDTKERIKKLKNNYYEFKHNRYIYELENDFDLKELDDFEILISSSNLDNYIKKCNVMLHKIDEYKKYDSNLSKVETIEEKPEKSDKVIEEEKPKKEVKSKLSIELEEAYNNVYKDIKKYEVLIDNLEKSIVDMPPFERKKKRFNFFGTILSNTLKLTLNILPFRFIKDRKVNVLTKGFLINNGIRTMRKTLSKDVVCDYVIINKYIKNEIELATNYERICRDSLYQVSVLKEEFVMHYGYLKNDEIMKVYSKLDELEEYITDELEKLTEINNNIGKVKKLTRKNK